MTITVDSDVRHQTGNAFHINLLLTVRSCNLLQFIYCMNVEYFNKILFKLKHQTKQTK